MNNQSFLKLLNDVIREQRTLPAEEEYLRKNLVKKLGYDIKSTSNRAYYGNIMGKISALYPNVDFVLSKDLLLKLFHTRLNEKKDKESGIWRSSEFLDSLHSIISDREFSSRRTFFENNPDLFKKWYAPNTDETDETLPQANDAQSLLPLSIQGSFEPKNNAESTPTREPVKRIGYLKRKVIAGAILMLLFTLAIMGSRYCLNNAVVNHSQYRVFFEALGFRDSIWDSSFLEIDIKEDGSKEVKYKGMFKDYPNISFDGVPFEGKKCVHVTLRNDQLEEGGYLIIPCSRLNADWWQRDTLFGIYSGVSRNENATAYKAVLVKEKDGMKAYANVFIRQHLHTPDTFHLTSRLFEGELPR